MAGHQPTEKAVSIVTVTGLTAPVVTVLAMLITLPPLTTLAAIPVPRTIWTHWNFDPVLLFALILAVTVYLRGMTRIAALRRHPPYPRYLQSVLRGRAIAYFTGIIALIVALVSPLDRLTTAVLWAHMTQYMVLTVIASLLLVVAHPTSVLLRGLPPAWSRSVRHWTRHTPAVRATRTTLANAYVIAAVDIAALIVWHVPIIYQAAVRYEPLHLLEVASFLVSGLLFWWAVRNPAASPKMGYGRVLSCFAITSVASLALGLVLFGSHTILYPVYLDRTVAWGLSPRGDQQLAGVILGVTPELFDVLTFIVILARWVQSEGART